MQIDVYLLGTLLSAFLGKVLRIKEGMTHRGGELPFSVLELHTLQLFQYSVSFEVLALGEF